MYETHFLLNTKVSLAMNKSPNLTWKLTAQLQLEIYVNLKCFYLNPKPFLKKVPRRRCAGFRKW